MLATIEESGEKISKDFVNFLEELPCAAYLVSNDIDLTFIHGNAIFYQLFGCTAEELRHQYGNRLGALIAPHSLTVLGSLLRTKKMNDTFDLKQQIKTGGTEAWVRTKVRLCQAEGAECLFCVSCDITESESKFKVLCDYASTVSFVTEQANLDAFEYNLATHAARFFATHSVLEQILPSPEVLYANIMETLLGSGAICPESIDTFKNAFASIDPNVPKVFCEVRMKTLEDTLLWVRCTLEINPTGVQAGRYAIGFLENITQQKEAYLNYLNETQFYQVMLAEKDAYGQLDATEDRIMMIGGMWNLHHEAAAGERYSRTIEQFAKDMVHPEDQIRYLDIMRCANFIESLENGVTRLGCEFRRRVAQDRVVWMELNVHLFKDSLTTHTLALVYMKNVDAGKRQERYGAEQLPALTAPSAAMQEAIDSGSLYGDFDAFVSAQGDLAYLVDPDTLTLLCGNQAFYDRLGLNRAECVGKKCYQLIHKRESPCPFCSRPNWSLDQFYLWKNYNEQLEQEFLVKNKLVQWQGKEWMLALAVDISNDKGMVDSVENGATESHCILRGVQRMAAAENLPAVINSALETVGHFFNADNVHFWEHDAPGHPYACTYAWTKQARPLLIGKDELREINLWLSTVQWERPVILESPESILGYSHTMYQMMKDNRIQNQRWLQLKGKGKEIGCIGIDNLSGNLQNIGFLEAFAKFIVDEMEKRRLMDGMLYFYQRDELTDLLSRNSYEKYLAHYSADDVGQIGVVLANFDQLKEINDSKGFHVGNYCIREFAHMLMELFPEDAVFRLNGDEFLVVAANIEQARLEDKIGLLEDWVKDDGTFSVSVGYSWDNVEKNLATLIEQATRAMRVNKQIHHDSVPNPVDSDRRQMLSELVASLRNHEFEMFLQPKVEFECHTLVGAEALVRYHHPTLGYILPVHFIEKLENANLIRYIDLFVFEEACKVLDQWRRQGVALPVISVNFSRITLLERTILSSVAAVMARYQVPKRQIEIEITESVSSIGKSILHQATNALRDAGFFISLDDFGTKYTNVAILSEINFDVLKLDRSLIGSLCGSHSNQVVLKSIIHMCRELGIHVIAEGVETQEQETLLRELGCTQGQGYLYGKPMTVAAFDAKYCQKP